VLPMWLEEKSAQFVLFSWLKLVGSDYFDGLCYDMDMSVDIHKFYVFSMLLSVVS
jgi:hypothetical protein